MIRVRIVVTVGLLLLGGLVASSRAGSDDRGVNRLPAGEQTTSRRGRRFNTRKTTTTTTIRPAATPTTGVPTTTAVPTPTTRATTPTTVATTTTRATTAPTVAPTTTRATTAPTVAPPTSAAPPTTPAPTAPPSTPAPTVPPAPPTTVTGPLPAFPAGVWQRVTPPSISNAVNGNNNFGMQAMASSASDPRVVYVGTSYQGIWRTTDAGTTWTKVNTGTNGANLETGRNWTMAVDPTNSNVVYTAAGYGSGQGLWKSVNGGRDWQPMMSGTLMSQTSPSIYNVAINPTNGQHILVAFHGPWPGDTSAGLIESKDGGATWTIHRPQASWGWGHYVHFIDSTTWLVATQYDGHWRGTNSGASWRKVSDQNMTHGGGALYRASTGVLYVGANNSVLRSTDNGISWTEVGPRVQDGYYAIVSDGTRMYIQSGNTGGNTLDPDPPYYTSLETDGTNWTPLNPTGTFPSNGPMSMVYDPANKVILSANWLAGVWRYKVP